MTAVTTPTAAAGPADRGARGDAPVRRLTVLYDAQCPLCTFVRGWLSRQRQLVPLEFVPAGSAAAQARYPGLDHAATLGDITVVGDGGQVYRGAAAWVVCMWALSAHRATAHRMTTPAGMRVAKQVVLGAAKYRERHRTAPVPAVTPGGGAYRTEDGWTYDRTAGWVHRPVPGGEDGWFRDAYGYGYRDGVGDGAGVGGGDTGAACDGGCRPGGAAD